MHNPATLLLGIYLIAVLEKFSKHMYRDINWNKIKLQTKTENNQCSSTDNQINKLW